MGFCRRNSTSVSDGAPLCALPADRLSHSTSTALLTFAFPPLLDPSTLFFLNPLSLCAFAFLLCSLALSLFLSSQSTIHRRFILPYVLPAHSLFTASSHPVQVISAWSSLPSLLLSPPPETGGSLHSQGIQGGPTGMVVGVGCQVRRKDFNIVPQRRSPQLYHQSPTTERQEIKGSIPESKVPFLLSVYIIIDINVLCAYTHMVPPQSHGIHPSKNNETYCALDPSVDVFLECESQGLDEAFSYLELTSRVTRWDDIEGRIKLITVIQ